MTAQKENSYRRMWVLGLALTLPVMVVCGGLAGYFLSVLLVQQMGLPGFLTPASVGLGILITVLQSYHLIQRLNLNSSKPK